MLRFARLTRLGALARVAGAAWFAVSSSHGVALMLVPALLPLCTGEGSARALVASGSVTMVLATVALHAAVMLAVLGVVACDTGRAAQRCGMSFAP